MNPVQPVQTVKLVDNNVIVSQTTDLQTYIKAQQSQIAMLNTQSAQIAARITAILTHLNELVPAPAAPEVVTPQA